MDVDDSPAPGESADEPKDLLVVIEEAVESVTSVDESPIEEHAERYKAVHASLQGALSDTDLRDSS